MSVPPSDDLRRPRAFRLQSDPAPQAQEPAPPPVPERPRAFRLDEGAGQPSRGVTIEPQPDPYAREAAADVATLDAAEAATEAAQRQGMLNRLRLSWGGVFASALGGLVSLGVSLWAWRLIDDLFARMPSLGWFGLVLIGLAAVALLAMGVREIVGIGRQRHIARLHGRLAQARTADDTPAACAAVADLGGLYAKRRELAAARATLASTADDIIDGRDRIDVAERELMGPLDRLARREIAAAAKRVSLVTAISPRAFVDLFFVVGQIVVLIRRIAEIYSGRPGMLGFLRLARSVGAHLAITGGMAVGDSLLQQAVGHGIAAKISARLGEGVLNGVLTTRVGLSAMAVCRPMPFAALKPPTARDVAPFLFGGDRAADERA